MAKNTYKENTYRKKKAERTSKGKGFSLEFSALFDRRIHLAAGFTLLAFSFFLLASFLSFIFTGKADMSIIESLSNTGIRPAGQEISNWLGISGAWMSYTLIYRWFGIASFLLVPLSFATGYWLVYKKKLVAIGRSSAFVSFFLVWISLLLGFIILRTGAEGFITFWCGGIGFELAILFDSLVGWGTFIILALSLVVFLVFFFDITQIFRGHPDEDVTDAAGAAPKQEVLADEDTGEDNNNQKEDEISDPDEETGMEEEDDGASWELLDTDKIENKILGEKDLELQLDDDIPEKREEIKEESREADLDLQLGKQHHEKEETELDHYDPTLDLRDYRFPDIDLLNEHDTGKVKVTKEELEQNKDKIVETLVNFKIGISSIKATIGPTVTLYEIVPEAGVKISKIKNLEDDIALSLSALGIRIIAPIPGKGTIGIEVPNKNREVVSMKSVVGTEKFARTDKELPVILGKTISNELYLTDLSKMPHLLMAGATGQGKSVGINVLLASLLFKKHPSQLKFVLIDPKKVELTLFNKIERHYLAKLPNSEEAIITDTKKVIYTLNSLCVEMDNRYDLLKDAGCRNIKEYNRKFIARKLNPQNNHRYLPYIVLVIDELADLMMTAGKEIETPIARLAQLARAIGIHLIVATQRPSVNVITGVIKANFPARCSFRVTSKVDSRTILDMGGAEQLVGMGDMLLSMGSETIRLQCPFIDTPEVDDLCDFIGNQRGYPDAYLLPEYEGDEESSVGEVDLSERDSMFDDAARLIVMHQQGSTSLIQRKLKLGYNRAGRLIDQLEAAGIVGPFEGSKAREVLVQDEYSLEQLLNSLKEKDNNY